MGVPTQLGKKVHWGKPAERRSVMRKEPYNKEKLILWDVRALVEGVCVCV